MRHFGFFTACSLSLSIAASLTAGPVYPAHDTVQGRTLNDWSALWWQSVFAQPVYAADGTTITHPQFDAGLNPGDTVNANHALPSADGRVTYLYGSFFGGALDRSVTVPANKPIFVPIINSEWSNPDTAAKPNFKNVPGNFTPQELADFAKAQTDTITTMAVTLDGTDIPDLLTHRETATAFTYTQPANHSITQTFFGETVPGPEASSADGFYLMLTPLAPGDHTLHFTASSPDNSATPPLLGAFSVDMTYHITAAGSAIPLPSGVWAGLTVLPLALVPGLRRRVVRVATR